MMFKIYRKIDKKWVECGAAATLDQVLQIIVGTDGEDVVIRHGGEGKGFYQIENVRFGWVLSPTEIDIAKD